MSLAAAIKAMVALGFTAEQIGAVVEKVDGERREKARAGNAKRQAEHRARHSKSNENNGVTGVISNGDNGVTDVTKTGGSSRARSSLGKNLSYIPPDDPNGSSTPKGAGVPKKSRSQNRGSRLPEDWQPKSEHLELALSLGMGRDRYQRALDEFRDYWRGVPGNRGIKLDWDATFRNRLRDIAERETRSQARAGPSGFSAGNLSTLMQKMKDQQNGKQSPGELKDITPGVSESRASDPPAHVHEPPGKPSGGGKSFDFGPASPDLRRSAAFGTEAARTIDWPESKWERG